MATEIQPYSTQTNHLTKETFPLSDLDMENLGNYLHGYHPFVSKGIHLYENMFDATNTEENLREILPLFNDIHLSPPFKDYYSKQSSASTFDLELAISGMPKNTRLPVPYQNHSLLEGRFGDDSGFTMQGVENNFLGSSFRLLREACSSMNFS